ncbi:MAG: OsmC family peroxiredoxin, partial [Gammaproteobacteria bacterium]|nr:OsmC family peroxiredoxin [Gammaproteobacteria bacterium]
LEVRAASRSDTRGLLGLPDAEGRPVSAGPQDVQLQVRIAASGVPAERLRALVHDGLRCSPIPNVLPDPLPLDVQIEVG